MAVGLGHAGMPESDALELVPTSIVRHVFLRRAAKPEVLVGDNDVDNDMSEHVEKTFRRRLNHPTRDPKKPTSL